MGTAIATGTDIRTNSVQAGIKPALEFFLLDRGPKAVDVRLVIAADGGCEPGRARARAECASPQRAAADVLAVLERLWAEGVCESMTLSCDAATFESVRRAALAERATRLVLPAGEASLVLRLDPTGAARLRANAAARS
jgi:hypothetical protein